MFFNFYPGTRNAFIIRSVTAIALLFAAISTRANNYYFSSSAGNDSYSSTQAQNQSTPWKSIAKLNSYFNNLAAGDVIYFKRGDVFYGSITATKSGSSSNPIVFTAYGSGTRPVISGLTTVSAWTSIGGNKYEASVPGVSTTLNLVVINGAPQPMGRYPNHSTTTDPYLYYESFASNGTSITDDQLSTSTNWKGADVVIKKRRWVMDRCKITNHSGGTLSYTNPNGYPGVTGFGYFITNDPRTIDQFGEWYLNPASKYLQVHFGGGLPAGFSVKVSTIDNLVNLGSYRYLTLRDLAFEGANVSGLTAQNGSNITVQQCDFTQMGKDGLNIRNSANTLIENVNVNRVLNNGVNLNNEYVTNTIIRNCNIRNIGMIPGMGANGDATYRGVCATVSSDCTIEYNNIDSIGYNALEFQGNNVNIRNNFINYFCCVKDDGGGIYSWANGGLASYSNRKIYNNIVLNAVGVPFGTAGKTAEAKGIYLDGASMNVEIFNNSVAHMGRTGLLLNNATNVKMNGNTVYNARFGVELVRLTEASLVRNIEMKKNIIYPKTSAQNAIYYKNMYLSLPVPISIQSDMQAIGTIDSNYYATPSDQGFGYYYCQNYTTIGTIITPAPMSLEGWKSYLRKDNASKRPAKTAPSPDDIRFEYNASTSAKTIGLNAKYVGVDGTVYNGSITLQPYTSKIIVKDGPATPPPSEAFKAPANTPDINCFGGNTTVTVSASGGTAPFTGTGSYNVNAGKGSLKISGTSSDKDAATLIYASVGAISSSKKYILRFSTLGTSQDGSLTVALRNTNAPYTNLVSSQTVSFDDARVDHEFLFTEHSSDANASFIIQLLQSSGTTYIDNIAFFEATSTGELISDNLFAGGQFETTIDNVFTWSKDDNHTASLDLTSKLNNTYYYPVKDSKGTLAIATAITNQPTTPLAANASAGTITILNGVTTVVVNATGGTAPYTGTGSFSGVKAGTYTYRVEDAHGCASLTTINIPAPVVTPLAARAISAPVNCYGNNTTVTVTSAGGVAPYIGTGSYSVNAGKGSLRVSVANPINKQHTLIYSSIGPVSSSKTYVLRFSTAGTINSGSLRAGLRQTQQPWGYLSPMKTVSYGTGRVDHEFIIDGPESQADASFIIELEQYSGNTYFDNIAFFESNSSGELLSENLYDGGQFENTISNLYTWSKTSNHVAALDQSGKISNTHYFPVRDARGAISSAAATVTQPAAPLVVSATGGIISFLGGVTSVLVNATGGTPPYTGTGRFGNIGVGTYTYTVRDANGCTSSTILTLSLKLALRSTGENSISDSATISGSTADLESRSATESNLHENLKISSYPNPSEADFNLSVKGGSGDKVSVIVQSIDGRIVYQTQGRTNTNYVFGDSFGAGMYIVKVIQGKTTQVLKLVKGKL